MKLINRRWWIVEKRIRFVVISHCWMLLPTIEVDFYFNCSSFKWLCFRLDILYKGKP